MTVFVLFFCASLAGNVVLALGWARCWVCWRGPTWLLERALRKLDTPGELAQSAKKQGEP